MLKTMLIAAAALGLSATAAADDFGYWVPGFIEGVEADGDGPVTLGWSFELRGYNALAGLGLYDAGEPGFAQNHVVTLWDAEGNVVAQVNTADGAGELIDGFLYVSPFYGPGILPAGIYTIGASDLGAGDGYLLTDRIILNNPYVRYLGGRYAPGAGVQFPLLTDSALRFGPGIWLVIPEPATWMLMIGGFGLVGAAQRMSGRRRTAATA